jgi:hypothetical protein
VEEVPKGLYVPIISSDGESLKAHDDAMSFIVENSSAVPVLFFGQHPSAIQPPSVEPVLWLWRRIEDWPDSGETRKIVVMYLMPSLEETQSDVSRTSSVLKLLGCVLTMTSVIVTCCNHEEVGSNNMVSQLKALSSCFSQLRLNQRLNTITRLVILAPAYFSARASMMMTSHLLLDEHDSEQFEGQQLQQLPDSLLGELQSHTDVHVAPMPVVRRKAASVSIASSISQQAAMTGSQQAAMTGSQQAAMTGSQQATMTGSQQAAMAGSQQAASLLTSGSLPIKDLVNLALSKLNRKGVMSGRSEMERNDCNGGSLLMKAYVGLCNNGGSSSVLYTDVKADADAWQLEQAVEFCFQEYKRRYMQDLVNTGKSHF